MVVVFAAVLVWALAHISTRQHHSTLGVHGHKHQRQAIQALGYFVRRLVGVCPGSQ